VAPWIARTLRNLAERLDPTPPPRIDSPKPVIIRIAIEASASTHVTDAAVTTLHLAGLQTAAAWIEAHADRCTPLTAREFRWIAMQLRGQARRAAESVQMGDA
jgi:hypothetical protein